MCKNKKCANYNILYILKKHLTQQIQILKYLQIFEKLNIYSREKLNICKFPLKASVQKIMLNEMSFCHKLKFSNPYIFTIWWCKPLIFQTLGSKDIEIRKVEFVAKTQLLSLKNCAIFFLLINAFWKAIKYWNQMTWSRSKYRFSLLLAK